MKFTSSEIKKCRNNYLFNDNQITGYKFTHTITTETHKMEFDYSLEYAYKRVTKRKTCTENINYKIAKYGVKIHFFYQHNFITERNVYFSTRNWDYQQMAGMENYCYVFSSKNIKQKTNKFLNRHVFDKHDVVAFNYLVDNYLKKRNMNQLNKLFILQDGM